tara:strand:- start:833 stop:1135 length:303 start_codon:yes stop_codon:yes gene_type:complete
MLKNMTLSEINACKTVFCNWRRYAELCLWHIPPLGKWYNLLYEKPIYLDKNGNELEYLEQKALWWQDLVNESNKNLEKEDISASIIGGALKGYITRKYLQ